MDIEAKNKDGVLILENEEDVKHLSPSQIKTFNDCQAKWAFRYVEGKKIPPSAVLTLGSSFDDAVTTGMNKKIEGSNLSVDEVVDAFCTSWDYRKDGTEFDAGEDPDEMKDKGVKMIKNYEKEVAPDILPAFTQKEYNVAFPGVDWTLKGFADIIDQRNLIIDNKTAGKTPSKDDAGEYKAMAEHVFQMVCYYISERMTSNKDMDLRIDYTVKLVNPKTVIVNIPKPDKQDIKYFQIKTSHTHRQMEMVKQGDMPIIPNRYSMLCSRKYCGYWSLCEQKYGGRVKS